MNPFQHLYDICNSGASADKLAFLDDGPRIIDIEPTSACNMRCVFCPTGLQATGRPAGFMTRQTHTAILDKTAPFRTALRYIGWGEPLLNCDLARFIAEAASRGRMTHLNTNGSRITRETAQDLVYAGLSSIKFSFQGTDRESYLAMRRTDMFDGLLEAIACMRDARGDRRLPFIAASTTTTTETPEQVAAFRARLEPLVDQLSIGKTIFEFIDMAAVPTKRRKMLEAAAAASTVSKRHPSPCPEIFDKLTVHWDGSVRVCCNDYSGRTNLGNIVTDDFASIWRHPTIEAYRANVARGEYTGPLCSVCFDYMDLTA